MRDLVGQMKMDMVLLSYSPRTIESYTYHVGLFLKALDKPAESVTEEDIRGYLYTMKTVKKAGQANLSQAFSAIKFLYRSTLAMPLKLSDVKSVRRGRTLPEVLSGGEIKRLFKSADNMKHKTILMTVYAAGLRLSEATHLKVSDIDGGRMQMRVEQGKGKKDRYVPLSAVLLVQLREYWRRYRPGIWLFPNRSEDRPISEGTVQKVFHRAKKSAHSKAGVGSYAAAQFRHACAGVGRRSFHAAASVGSCSHTNHADLSSSAAFDGSPRRQSVGQADGGRR